MASGKSNNEASYLPQKSVTFETGEPSSTNNHDYDSLIQFYDCINQLKPKHKDCLYSLGIFPENANLKKRLLLYWWIGLGLSLEEENKNITNEQVAETFFCDLVKMKILQPIHTRKHNQVVDCCIINPKIHTWLFSACKNSNLLTDMKSTDGTLRFYRDEKSKVRALLSLNDQYLKSEDITKMVSSENPTMQVAQFGNWHCTNLKFGNMNEGDVSERIRDHIEADKTDFLAKLGKKVAFLSLRSISGIEELPDSIGKLDDLMILDLRSCHNLATLPKKGSAKSNKILGLVSRQQMWLKNLTHLDISECFLLDHIPKWVCELFNLEVLKGFVASNAGKEKELCRLGDLSKLKKLRKLSVRIAMHLDPEDLSVLKTLESLFVLTLTWDASKQFGGEQIIMADQADNQYKRSGKVPKISFPKNLEKLDIRGYPKVEAPELLNPAELQKLKRLYIRGGKLTKIGNKPGWKVEILRLRYLKYLDFNWYHLSRIFGELKCVEYKSCFNLIYFPEDLSYWSTETNGPFPSARDGVKPTINNDEDQPHRQQKKELKVRIDDFVGPILKQLVEAKNHDYSSHLSGDIKETCELVEKTKVILKNRKQWDSELMGYFEKIQRIINYYNENKEESDEEKGNIHKSYVRVKEELQNFLEIKEAVNVPNISSKSDNHALDSRQKSVTFETGEPSSTNNHDYDSLNQFYDCINQLKPKHKYCLYSLGIFPENANLKKRLLLYWWIGLGLSLEEENKNITNEQVAETFFCDLVKMKILQPIHTRKHNQVVDCCIINPKIHTWLFSACKNSNLLTDMNRTDGTLRFYRDDKSKVRALLNLNDQYLKYEDITEMVSSENPTMQVAQFGNWHCTNLKFGNMNEGDVSERIRDHIEADKTDFLAKLGKKVAFLSLRSISRIEELPDSIGKLDDLMILDLRSCHNLATLPKKGSAKSNKILGLVSRQQMWLKNLTHLDISECFLLDHIPKWVCELFNLEVLKGFVASNAGKEKELCRLGDLSKLKKLRKLSVRIAMHLDPEDLSVLKTLESLLVLTWDASKQFGGEQIIMADQADNQYKRSGKVPKISFPKNLEKLDIRGYPKVEAPVLLNPAELQNLKRLYIRGGKLTKIGNKPGWKVEILRLRYLKYLGFNWYHLSSIFGELKYVEYEKCFNLKYFPKELSYWSLEANGPFPGPSDEPSQVLALIDRGPIHMRITRNRTVPLAYHESTMLLELTARDSISERPGLDLVVVLDVCKHMNEEFIRELKIAMLFVIKKLSSIDRLSIVTISSRAKMVYPLSRVTKSFQKEAENLVKILEVTNDELAEIAGGLLMGLKIIRQRSNSSGRVAAIMLLARNNGARLPYFNTDDVAVHTFGLGEGSNSPHPIGVIPYDSKGGTFSDVPVAENLTKAVSVCLAGLLTVAVQDLTLTISPIEEANIKNDLNRHSGAVFKRLRMDGSLVGRFGDLYSGEVRKILVKLQLPKTDKERMSDVLKISCSYKVKEVLFEHEPVIVTVARKIKVPSCERQPPPEVIVEVYRQDITDDKIFDIICNLLDNKKKIMKAQDMLKEMVKGEPSCNALLETLRPVLQHLLYLTDQNEGEPSCNALLETLRHELQHLLYLTDKNKGEPSCKALLETLRPVLQHLLYLTDQNEGEPSCNALLETLRPELQHLLYLTDQNQGEPSCNALLETLRHELQHLLYLTDQNQGEPSCKALLETLRPELQHLLYLTDQNRGDAARSFARSCWLSHWTQRAAARGIKPEKFMAFYTPTMVEFLKQAEEFRARILGRREEIISPSPDEES